MTSFNWNSIRSISTLLLLVCTGVIFGQVIPRVELIEGEPAALRFAVQSSIQYVLRTMNLYVRDRAPLEDVKKYCTDAGFASIKLLVDKDKLYANYAIYRTNLVMLQDHLRYEVRDIEVWAQAGTAKEYDPTRILVFTINTSGKITDMSYGIPKHYYKDMVGDGTGTISPERRQRVVEFLERFRTAYNRRSSPDGLNFLKGVFHDSALIIVGRKSPDQIIQHTQMTTSQYLNRLESIAKARPSIDVLFQNIKIIQHPDNPNLCGVKLWQKWNCRSRDPSDYHDEGHLFLGIEFLQSGDLKIHVRVWQFNEIEKHERIDFGPFETIRSKGE